MTLRRWTGIAALLTAAACGGGADAEAADPAAADTQALPAAATPPVDGGTPVPATEVPTGADAPQAAAPEPAPTAADSAAAAREDVSPEWKQRERTMGSYEDCMEQTKGADAALRPRLEAACARLPGAPR